MQKLQFWKFESQQLNISTPCDNGGLTTNWAAQEKENTGSISWPGPAHKKLFNFCEQLFHNCQCKSMLQLNLCLCKPFFGQLEKQTHVPSIHLQQWQREQLKEWENNYGLWKISLLWRCFKWCHVALWKFRLRFEASGLPPLKTDQQTDSHKQ